MYAARAPLRQSVCIYLRYGSICIAALIHCCNNTHTHTHPDTHQCTLIINNETTDVQCVSTRVRKALLRAEVRGDAPPVDTSIAAAAAAATCSLLFSLSSSSSALSRCLCVLSLLYSACAGCKRKRTNVRFEMYFVRVFIFFSHSLTHSLTCGRSRRWEGGGGGGGGFEERVDVCMYICM